MVVCSGIPASRDHERPLLGADVDVECAHMGARTMVAGLIGRYPVVLQVKDA